MDTQTETLSLKDRLKALKEQSAGDISTVLPVSGIAASYPGFVSHDKVMAATKVAGKDRSKVGMILVSQVARFEGERLTVAEIGSLLHNKDTVHLINLVLGEDDAGSDGEGGGEDGGGK